MFFGLSVGYHYMLQQPLHFEQKTETVYAS